MKIKHKKLTDEIHLLVLENQEVITRTFLRFQEHYESPHFKGKVFTLDQFRHWYTKNSPDGIKTGKFTYYTDWNGFNFPSYVLKPFYAGHFDPLSTSEGKILEIFRRKKDPFYIVAVHKKVKNIKKYLRHEIAHGLFYTNPDYKKEVRALISKFDVEKIKEELREMGGYHKDVLDDEVHAYCLDDQKSSSLKSKIPKDLTKGLKRIFRKYYK